MTICWYEICDELTIWLTWLIISPTSSKMKSMTKTSNLKNLKTWKIWNSACIKDLRRVNRLIDWNWDSNVKFRLIAKISVLNELNSLLNLRRNRSWIDWSIRRAQKKYFYLYVVQILFRFSFCSFVKLWFSCCIATFAQNIFFENIEMMFLNVWRKMLLIWRENCLLEEFSIR